jgi:class 3 adenylate cyclase
LHARQFWTILLVSDDEPMNSPQTCAVLFVDISGSTRLYEELGDEQALARVDGCLRLLQRATDECAGRVVKTTGDGLMCAFEEPAAALHAARIMHLRVLEQGALGGPTLGIHVGCHYGQVLESAGDLYGDCVNVAARIAGLAKVGQIITTLEVVERLTEALREKVRMLDRVTVKGRRESLEIFELVWQESDELTMLGTRSGEERVPRLRLAFAGRELWFDGSGSGAVTLGRDAVCDIVIEDRKASRQHARIEKRRDKFVLADHSSNGTYVAIAGEAEMCLRREELILRAHGRIALGHRTSETEATVVEFSMNRSDDSGLRIED